MRGLQVVGSMKDFYWDIRPKPEYGTIEIRVCDTPLTVEKAAALAAFAQALARWLVEQGPPPLAPELYSVYGFNRFLACRFGLEAEFIDAAHAREGPAQGRPAAHAGDRAQLLGGRFRARGHRLVRGTVEQGATTAPGCARSIAGTGR